MWCHPRGYVVTVMARSGVALEVLGRCLNCTRVPHVGTMQRTRQLLLSKRNNAVASGFANVSANEAGEKPTVLVSIQ